MRRYGFHGTSHRYVCQRTAQWLRKPTDEICMISAHLGNGSSACAIVDGKSVDTTMGLTPLEGLVMGTRSGDIDPGILPFLCQVLKTDVQVNELLNRKSGLLGLSELSNDCRELLEAEAQGHQGAHLALEVFVHRLAKAIAGLMTNLPRIDAVSLRVALVKMHQVCVLVPYSVWVYLVIVLMLRPMQCAWEVKRGKSQRPVVRWRWHLVLMKNARLHVIR